MHQVIVLLESVASRTDHDQHVIRVFTHAHRSFLIIFSNTAKKKKKKKVDVYTLKNNIHYQIKENKNSLNTYCTLAYFFFGPVNNYLTGSG